MHLSRFPRLPFAHLPTPLEFLPRLTERLRGPNIYVKRDDCTGLASGGNKTRKLEFLIADAVKQGAETIITQGAVPVRRHTADDRHGLDAHDREADDPVDDGLRTRCLLDAELWGQESHHARDGTKADADL